MAKAVETANPEQYLRLLLVRLLETQKCLSSIIHLPVLSPLRGQYQTNAYTLSEIESWLKGQPPTSPLGPPCSCAQDVERRGGELPPRSETPSTERGTPTSPFVWSVRPEVHSTPQQVRSSLPSGTTLPASAEVLNGRIVFLPPSSPMRPPST